MIMKKIMILLFVIISIQFGYGQYPETLGHYNLVNVQELNEDFILFIPDTATQILINPARAAEYDQKFFYVNYNNREITSYSSLLSDYRSVSSIYYDSYTGRRVVRRSSLSISSPVSSIYYSSPEEPAFSVVSLFNALGSKWMINFSHDIAHTRTVSDDNDTQMYERNRESYYDYQYGEISALQNNSNEYSYTDIVLSRIGNSGLGNYSLGIFGSYNQGQRDYDESYEREQYYTSFSGYQNRYGEYLNSNHRIVNRKSNIYQLGLSFSLNWEKGDYIGRISYQKSDFLENSITHEFILQRDTTTHDTVPDYLVTSKNILTEDTELHSKYNPGSYQFYNFYQRNMRLISSNDHLFIRINGFYSSDDRNYYYDSRTIHDNSSYHYESGYNIYQDTLNVFTDEKTILDNWAVDLSLGYTALYKVSDIKILAGLNPRYQIIHTEGEGINSNIIASTEELKALSVTLPLYVNYSPEKWISIYGGFNYWYVVNWLDNNYNLVDEQIYSDDRIRINTTKYESEYRTIRTSRGSYLGVNLKHKSGLRCMLYFSSDITTFKTWNISLGYHF